MLVWKCKYYHVCGSLDNCSACRGKKELIKEEIDLLLKLNHKSQKE
jgi:hypothetical protein